MSELTPEVVKILQRILETAERAAASLDRIAKQSVASAPKDVASEALLDGEYGDPEIKRDPPRWDGPPVAPRRMSQCSADYLDVVAGFYDWAAGKADEKGEVTVKGKPVSEYKRRDAALARGWAARIRSGWKLPDIPF